MLERQRETFHVQAAAFQDALVRTRTGRWQQRAARSAGAGGEQRDQLFFALRDGDLSALHAVAQRDGLAQRGEVRVDGRVALFANGGRQRRFDGFRRAERIGPHAEIENFDHAPTSSAGGFCSVYLKIRRMKIDGTGSIRAERQSVLRHIFCVISNNKLILFRFTQR